MIDGFRERLRGGEVLMGTMLNLPSAAIAEVLAAAGFDWLFIDGEHGPIGPAELVSVLQAVDRDLACIMRVPELNRGAIKHALDMGSAGIIVPQVETGAEAAEAVRLARYAPQGERGMGLARAHRYGFGFSDYVARANDEIAVVIQAEHARAVENIEAIVAVEGLDAVFLGPCDIHHPRVAEAIDRITEVCQAAGMPLGYFGLDARAVAPFIARGYSLICASVDCVLLGQGAKRLLDDLRSQVD